MLSFFQKFVSLFKKIIKLNAKNMKLKIAQIVIKPLKKYMQKRIKIMKRTQSFT